MRETCSNARPALNWSAGAVAGAGPGGSTVQTLKKASTASAARATTPAARARGGRITVTSCRPVARSAYRDAAAHQDQDPPVPPATAAGPLDVIFLAPALTCVNATHSDDSPGLMPLPLARARR